MTSDDEAEPGRCLNCDAALVGEYCHVCGQRDTDPRASLWEVLGEFVREAFEIDGRLPRTIVPFLFRPGYLAREYMAGRRARYTSPVRLYVFAALVSFFMLQRGAGELIGGEDVVITRDGIKVDRSGGQVEPPEASEFPSERDEASEEFAKELEAGTEGEEDMLPSRYEGLTKDAMARTMVADFFGWAPLGALALIVLYASLLGLFHRRLPFLTHLVASTHVHTFALLAFGVAALIGQSVAMAIAMALIEIYVLVSLVQTYERAIWKSVLEWVALNIIYWLIAALVFAGVFLAALQLGG